MYNSNAYKTTDVFTKFPSAKCKISPPIGFLNQITVNLAYSTVYDIAIRL